MSPGSFVSGNLENLGWAVYRGPDYDVTSLEQLNAGKDLPLKIWNGSSLDGARKYFIVSSIDMSSTAFNTCENHFRPIVDATLIEFKKIIKNLNEREEQDTDVTLNEPKVKKERVNEQNYEAKKWSIFKNEGTSEGQPLHCDYPRAHDNEKVESVSESKHGK